MGSYTNYEIKVFLLLYNSKGELLLSMNNHKDSIIYGYVNPIGGHVEIGESIIDTTRREVKEEVGIEKIKNIQLKGIVNVEGFKESQVLMFVISADVEDGEIPEEKEEGRPVWVNLTDLDKYKVLEDVKKIIELSEKANSGEIFHAISKFENRKLISFNVR